MWAGQSAHPTHHLQVWVDSDELYEYMDRLAEDPSFHAFGWQALTEESVLELRIDRALGKLRQSAVFAAGIVRLLVSAHFVAIFCDLRQHAIEFYDPLGNQPTENLWTFMKKLRDTFEARPSGSRTRPWSIVSLDMQHQHDGDNCGFFCLAHIQQRLAGKTARSINLTLVDVEEIRSHSIFGELAV
jgi:hypothetical protein